MTRLKLLAYGDLARVAEMAGFHWKRSRGSHNTFQSEDGRTIVIPDHGNQVIVRPLLRKIIRDMGLTADQYHEFVEKLQVAIVMKYRARRGILFPAWPHILSLRQALPAVVH